MLGTLPGARRWWERAGELASRTPDTRNRYVDFLRGASITVVVIGHWLMAVPSVERGAFTLSDMLHVAPWSQWLTWVFQVMPLFFIVGGYVNAASWMSHRREERAYAAWVSRRLQRLLHPVVPLVVVWCALALTARWIGLSARLVDQGSMVAFVPTWFLAVYVLVVVVAPFTHTLWMRLGLASFWAFALGAVAVDAVVLSTDFEALRWVNYVFVWLALHQLGHAWRHGALPGPGGALVLAGAALTVPALLVAFAGYPVSMVTVPGAPAANSNPPTLALLALGVAHGLLVRAAEAPARRWLDGVRVWRATVFVNGAILTIYLWHATAMVLLVVLLGLWDGVGLELVPDTPEWWLTRPIWIVALLVVLASFVAAFGRFEARVRWPDRSSPAAWRSIAGPAAVCVGLVWLAAEGIGAPGPPGFRVLPVLLTLAGIALAGALAPARPGSPAPRSG